MTIRLLTGAPGAGKTTFGVSQILAKLMGAKLVIEDGPDAGSEVERRCLVAGVRGLILDHEKLPHRLTGDAPPAYAVEFWNQVQDVPSAEGTIYAEFVKGHKLEHLEDEPLYQRLPTQPPLARVPKGGTVHRVEGDLELDDDGNCVAPKAKWIDVPCLVQNWWLWCRPGDTIFIDEVQFLAPRGSLTRKPPLWIQLLEIHRHYGVDFVLVTQHPQLVDNVIRSLVGHHEHVRPIMGSSLCSVYTWDHASNPDRFTLANKRLWRRGRKDYRLFHSSAAHIKPPSAGRGILVLVPLLMLGVVGGGYAFTGRWRTNEVPVAALPAAPHRELLSSSLAASGVDTRVIAGCWSVGDDCKCIDGSGRRQAVAPTVCLASAAGYSGEVTLSALAWAPKAAPVSLGQYGAAAGGSNAGVAVSDQQ